MKTHTDSFNSDDSSRLPSDMGHTPILWGSSPEFVAEDLRRYNSHQALVEALEELVNSVYGMGYQDIPVIEQSMHKARAALRSATP